MQTLSLLATLVDNQHEVQDCKCSSGSDVNKKPTLCRLSRPFLKMGCMDFRQKAESLASSTRLKWTRWKGKMQFWMLTRTHWNTHTIDTHGLRSLFKKSFSHLVWSDCIVHFWKRMGHYFAVVISWSLRWDRPKDHRRIKLETSTDMNANTEDMEQVCLGCWCPVSSGGIWELVLKFRFQRNH